MALEKTIKQGYESYFIFGNFSEVMEEDETITTWDIGIVDKAGTDCSETMIESDSPAAGEGDDVHKLFVRIQGGSEPLSPYKVTMRIVTSLGNKWEVDGNIVIKEK